MLLPRTDGPELATVLAALARAAGHALVYGVVVGLVEARTGGAAGESVLPAAMISAFAVWWILARDRPVSIPRLIAVGYGTVAIAAAMLLYRLGGAGALAPQLGRLLLPLILVVTGTAGAAITVAYGLGWQAAAGRRGRAA